MSENNGNGPKTAPCLFCNEQVDADGCYCYGCGKIVCGDCDQRDLEAPLGSHDASEHQPVSDG